MYIHFVVIVCPEKYAEVTKLVLGTVTPAAEEHKFTPCHINALFTVV